MVMHEPLLCYAPALGLKRGGLGFALRPPEQFYAVLAGKRLVWASTGCARFHVSISDPSGRSFVREGSVNLPPPPYRLIGAAKERASICGASARLDRFAGALVRASA